MPTANVLLSPGSALLPDGSGGNLAAAISRRQGSEGAPKKHFLTLVYSGAGGAAEHAWWQFIMPSTYGSGGSLVVLWMTSATSGNVKWQARVGAITASDADTPIEHAQAGVQSQTTAANPTEAYRLNTSTITLSMDSAAAGDLIFLTLLRDSSDAADTCSSNAEVIACEFHYTTA